MGSARFFRGAVAVGMALGIGLLAACGDDPLPGEGGTGGANPGTGAGTVTVALFAGSLQGAGSQDGVGTAAQFNSPSGVAQDVAGNAYVADTANHTLRRIAPDGTVTTLAGTAGQAGSTDGGGAAARLSSPRGIAIDGAGNLYVADSGNHVVRKVQTGGVVTTVAGVAGQSGTVDGGAQVARLQSPSDVALDAAGNLYVVSGGAVRRISPDGTVATFATSRALPVTAVTVDGLGNVYVAESPASGPTSGAGTVRKLSSQGEPLAWGGAADGIVGVPYPADLAADSAGNVYVAVSGAFNPVPSVRSTSRLVVRISSIGEVATVAGLANDDRTADGIGTAARLRDPRAISLGAGGRLVVVETEPGTVRQIDSQGRVSTLAGGQGDGLADGQGTAARLFDPRGIAAAADGTLYVADSGNRALRRISSNGAVTTVAAVAQTSADGPATGFSGALTRVAVTPSRVFVEGVGGSPSVRAVYGIEASGRYRGVADSTRSASGLAATPTGQLYLASTDTVFAIDANGNRSTLATGFQGISDIAYSPSGLVYVADQFDHTVRSINAQGQVTLVAGAPGISGSVDGTASQSRLNGPANLALDGAGNLYVADATTLRKITPQGNVTTVASLSGRVNGLAFSSGALYATLQNAVLKISPVN